MSTEKIRKIEKTYGSLPIHVDRYSPRVREHILPVILVHGAWTGSWIWKNYAEFLAEEGWDIYALNLRGHGKSGGDVAGTTMEDYVQDIHTVVEEALLGSAVIVGHSMGGLVALMYGVEHDPAAVVAIDPSAVKQVMEDPQPTDYADEYTPQDAGIPKELKEEMEALPDIEKKVLKKYRETLIPDSGTAANERSAGISIPKSKLPKSILFVGSEKGTSQGVGTGIEKTREMAEYYKKDVVEIPGATHPGALIGESWETGAGAIDEWLTIQFEADFSDMDMDPFDVL